MVCVGYAVGTVDRRRFFVKTDTVRQRSQVTSISGHNPVGPPGLRRIGCHFQQLAGMILRPTDGVRRRFVADFAACQEILWADPRRACGCSTSYEGCPRANGVDYGLTAGVFTKDLATAHQFGPRFGCLVIMINDFAPHSRYRFGESKPVAWPRRGPSRTVEPIRSTRMFNVNFGAPDPSVALVQTSRRPCGSRVVVCVEPRTPISCGWI